MDKAARDEARRKIHGNVTVSDVLALAGIDAEKYLGALGAYEQLEHAQSFLNMCVVINYPYEACPSGGKHELNGQWNEHALILWCRKCDRRATMTGEFVDAESRG